MAEEKAYLYPVFSGDETQSHSLELSQDLILPFPYLRTYILSVKVWKLPW